MAVRILVTESTDEEGLEMLRREKGFSVDVRYDLGKEDGRQELLKIIPEYDALIVRSATKADAELLGIAKKMKVVGRAGTGLDNIDTDAATRKGILVMNTPSGNTISAAEHTIALLLSLVRKLSYGNRTLKNYEWKRHAILGTELRGKTIGIVGLGRIGSQVAKRCKAFEMNVVAYDPYILKEKATGIGVELLPKLDDLLSIADIISVHTPLNEETKGMISREQIAKSKDGVFMVNCARGGIMDEEALCEALETGKVAGAALDVFAQEPPKKESISGKLVAQENVIVTPHLGANTRDAQRTVAVLLAEQMIAALKGLPCDAVNLPFSLDAKALPKVRIFMQLGEMLGELQSQIAETRIREINVSFQGIEEEAKKPIMVAAVKGFLSATEDEVNYVNAMFLAKERGMNVKESSSSQTEDYSNLVTVSATSETSATALISASLFSGKQIRIVRLNQLEFEIKPTKYMLVVHNRDVPGVVGKIGTTLGSNKINIADFHLCRDSIENKMAGSIINLDSDVPEEVLKQLLSNEDILSAKVIKLKAL